MIYAIKTTVGQEKLVVDMLSNKAKQEDLPIYSLVVMAGLKGYIMLETEDELTARRLIYNVPHIKARGIVSGGVNIDELSGILDAKPLMESIKEGQKVEIISGPFKGEKAKVVRINTAKEELTVELLEATVKIPVTIHAENVRVMKE